jgi:DNA topoisomerase-1
VSEATTKGSRPRLVIVESPAKAKTISGYLGRDYVVESSIGHIRDLPGSAAEMPPEQKELWKTYGIDVEHDFEPVYVVSKDKKQQVTRLRKALKDADELLLATDEDREGEAIAWHLVEVLQPKVPVRRMVFHEITPSAIREAIDNPRDIDRQLVDAQETRRVLDRLYGYEVSPVLWKKVMRGLSAGRVQSVATRLVVERERERMAFRAADYWDLVGVFDTGREQTDATDPRSFDARLVGLNGQRVATGRDFGPDGALKNIEGRPNGPTKGIDVARLDEAAARGLAERLIDAPFTVRSVEKRPYRRSPYAPFRTTTLQQEGSRKLSFGAERTMRVAQRLYEGGYITYMRTDSTTLSETAVKAARAQARQLYGDDYVPETPRRYDSKVKNAQEAHEAIRPAGDTFRTPGEVASELQSDERRLYELIWQRTVASQMADATGQSVSVRLGAITSAGDDAEFGATGKVITFPGFLRVYVEDADDPDTERDDKERRLPAVDEGDALTASEITPEGHSTKPPPRYTEATLVKELEDREIGRPSTYASIIGTILDRGYVTKRGSALVPSFVAFAVVTLLEKHFARLVDYDFTARMEDDLDRIANGEALGAPWLHSFYFGEDGEEGLHALVSDLGEIDAREVNSLPVGDGIVLRVGRYGPFVERGDQRASVPEDLAPDELTVEKADELLSAPSEERTLGQDPETGRDLVAKAGRYGPYITEVLPEGSKDKPRTASLFKSMSLDTVTLDDALRLFTLPRVLGSGEDGEEITAQNGRYGPYVKKGRESRSLESEEQLFTVTLDDALALLAQPKTRGRRAPAAPLREIGTDPATKKEIVLREGRYGPYVTDGETNASLKRGDDPATVTVERAAELLADRRARGPAPKRKRASTRSSR